jgi:diguanylate cyclase (GGDEF)-like protein
MSRRDSKPTRVLIVDDEADLRLSISALLEAHGFEVKAVTTGEQALESFRADVPDVLVLDIHLPGMDGTEVLKQVRATHPEQVAVMMTAYPTLDSAVTALQQGATDYVRKPFDNVELVEAVQRGARRVALQRQQLALEQELVQASTVDPVTGLRNRRHFDATLDREVRRARRQGHDLALLMLDLDGFKAFNDRRGHVEGDALLSQVGECIARHVRTDVDEACRYGGDEFSIILVEADGDRARTVADRICASIRRRTAEEATVSIGVGCFRAGMDGVELIRVADAALYQVKADGGDGVCVAEQAAR